MIQFLVDFVTWSPLVSMAIFSLIISIIMNVLYILLIDVKKMRELKEEQSNLQKEMKANKNDQAKMLEIQQKSLEISGKMMKMTMTPMFVTFIPAILAIYFLKMLYIDWVPVGNIIYWEKDLWLIHDGAGWFLCYFVFSVIFSTIIKKIFKI